MYLFIYNTTFDINQMIRHSSSMTNQKMILNNVANPSRAIFLAGAASICTIIGFFPLKTKDWDSVLYPELHNFSFASPACY
jgi:hypothetical protein